MEPLVNGFVEAAQVNYDRGLDVAERNTQQDQADQLPRQTCFHQESPFLPGSNPTRLFCTDPGRCLGPFPDRCPIRRPSAVRPTDRAAQNTAPTAAPRKNQRRIPPKNSFPDNSPKPNRPS